MIEAAPHRFPVRVYYEDTDLGGVVYHANYLRFFERGRSEMLRDAGVDQAALKSGEDLVFMVLRCDVRFHRPARYDDLLSVETRVERIGGASLALDQRLIRPGEEGPLVAARVDVACVRLASGRPARLPAPLRERLDALAADRDSASAGAPPLDAAEAAR